MHASMYEHTQAYMYVHTHIFDTCTRTYINGGLSLVSSQHPDLYVGLSQCLNALWNTLWCGKG